MPETIILKIPKSDYEHQKPKSRLPRLKPEITTKVVTALAIWLSVGRWVWQYRLFSMWTCWVLGWHMAHTAITGCVLCHTLGNTLRNAPTWHYEGTVPNICTVFFCDHVSYIMKNCATCHNRWGHSAVNFHISLPFLTLWLTSCKVYKFYYFDCNSL